MHAYVSSCYATWQVPAVAVAETRTPTPRDPRGTAARELSDAPEDGARERLTQALQQLSADLLAHLQYEEDHISDTLRTWPDWPSG